jgi:hypothetical protein
MRQKIRSVENFALRAGAAGSLPLLLMPCRHPVRDVPLLHLNGSLIIARILAAPLFSTEQVHEVLK